MLTANNLSRDYNFFSEYLADSWFIRSKAQLPVLGLMIIVVFMGGFFAFTEARAYMLRKDISEMKEFLNSEEIVKARQEFQAKKKRFDIMSKYRSSVAAAGSAIDSIDKVKSSFLENVAATVPDDVTYKTMTLTPDQLNIQGIAANMVTVAEFYHNLDSTGLFRDVYLSTIQQDGATADRSSYNIQCILKDVTQQ